MAEQLDVKLEKVQLAVQGEELLLKPVKRYRPRCFSTLTENEIFTYWSLFNAETKEVTSTFHVKDEDQSMTAFDTNGVVLFTATGVSSLAQETIVSWSTGQFVGKVDFKVIEGNIRVGKPLTITQKNKKAASKDKIFIVRADRKFVGKISLHKGCVRTILAQDVSNPVKRVLLLISSLKHGHASYGLHKEPLPIAKCPSNTSSANQCRLIISKFIFIRGAWIDRKGKHYYEIFNSTGSLELVFMCDKISDNEMHYKATNAHGINVFHAKSTESRVEVFSASNTVVGHITGQSIFDSNNIERMKVYSTSKGAQLTIRRLNYRNTVGISKRLKTIHHIVMESGNSLPWKMLILSAFISNIHSCTNLPELPKTNAYIFPNSMRFVTPSIMSLV